MDISKIENFFSPEKLVAICNEEFSTLKEQVTINLQTKRTNSGKNVNSLNVPEETTGATADSMASQVESNARGFTVSFVGRHNIKNIDEGNSPQDAQEEFGSFESFYQNIKQWARDKEARYGLEFKASTHIGRPRSCGRKAASCTAREGAPRLSKTCCRKPWITSTKELRK